MPYQFRAKIYVLAPPAPAPISIPDPPGFFDWLANGIVILGNRQKTAPFVEAAVGVTAAALAVGGAAVAFIPGFGEIITRRLSDEGKQQFFSVGK